MDNPVLVEVLRGQVVESRHRGALAIVDADGGTVLALGDVARPVFPRSAVKGLQALPLIETGAADRFGLSEAEIALACASHSAEEGHLALADSVLRKAGRDVTCLECGAQWPRGEAVWRKLVTDGKPASALHNNCSGKHAGFICIAEAIGVDPAGYVAAGHRVQGLVRETLEEVIGAPHDEAHRGTDGCSIPTYAVPLEALARAFARFATGRGLCSQRAAAAARIRAAVAKNPFAVAGTGRFDTEIMTALGARAFTKTGAEGVYCAALPQEGLGIALKCDDGAGRAAEAIMAAALIRALPKGLASADALAAHARPTIRNWNGIETGMIRPAGPLAGG